MTPSEFPVTIRQPVAWGDMDAYAHVNNIRYFRYFESSRVRYFEEVETGQGNVGPILAETSCKYLFPVTYPDTLIVGSRVMTYSEDRFEVQHAAWSEQHDRLVAIGTAIIVPYDYEALAKADLPPEWIEAIVALESRAGRTPEFSPRS